MPVSTAIDSSGCEQVVQLWRTLPVFETVGDNPQCQSLCLASASSHGLLHEGHRLVLSDERALVRFYKWR